MWMFRNNGTNATVVHSKEYGNIYTSTHTEKHETIIAYFKEMTEANKANKANKMAKV